MEIKNVFLKITLMCCLKINAKYLYTIQTHNRFDILANYNEQLNNIHLLDYVKTKRVINQI